MKREEILAAVRELADRVATEMGLEVIEIVLRGGGSHRVLRIDVDRVGPRGVDLDDCARMSRRLGDELDAVDLVPGSFTLELSSPGLDRPIRSADDVRRNTGRRVIVEVVEPWLGRRQFRGCLKGANEGEWLLEDDDAGDVAIPTGIVRFARQDPAV